MNYFKRFYILLIEKFRVDLVIAGIFLIINCILYNKGTFIGKTPDSFVASVIGTAFILMAIPFLLKPFARSIVTIIILLLSSVILFADTMFFRYFSNIISVGTLTQAGLLGSVTNSITSLLHLYDILLFQGVFVLIIVYAIYFILKKITKHESKIEKLFVRLITMVIILIIGVSSSCLGVSQMLVHQKTILNTFYDRVYMAQRLGYLNYHALDACKFIKDINRKPISEEEIEKISSFLLKKQEAQEAGKYLEGVAKGKNLIVIQTEALQSFVIGARINGKLIAPNLTKLVNETQYFENYYYETANGGTADAEFLSNVSMFPVKEGAVYNRYSGNVFNSMPSILKENGYSTAVMHANRAGFWNRSIMYKTLKFDEYYSKKNMVQDEIMGMGLSDKSFFKQMLPIIKNSTQPSYNFLITLTSHYPYDNMKENVDPNFSVGKYKGTTLGKYLIAMHYTDAALGEFLENLKKEGILDNTLLAIYGDHFAIPYDNKDELLDFLKLKKNVSYNWIVNQKVPMFIRIPGVSGKKWHISGGSVDLMPTLMNLLGVDTSSATMFGRDLMNSNNGYSIMRFASFRKNNLMFDLYDNKAYQVPTGKALSIDKYSNDIEYMKMSLEYSDEVIENNLVEKVVTKMNELKNKNVVKVK